MTRDSRTRSPGRLPGRSTHGSDDIVGVRPGLAQELGEQPPLAGHDRAAVDQDIELSTTTALELDGTADGVLDPGGVTRRLRAVASGFAVENPDVHACGSQKRRAAPADLV